MKYWKGTADALNAGTKIDKLPAQVTFGRPPEQCVINGGLRPPARRIPARTIQARRPEAGRRRYIDICMHINWKMKPRQRRADEMHL